MQPDEDQLLRKFYKHARIPVDQFKKRPPDDLESFVRNWNRATNRSDKPDEILHYVMTKRKNGDWPRLDGNHKSAPSIHNLIEFNERDWETLLAVYEQVVVPQDIGTDSLVHDDELAELVAYKFCQATGQAIPSHLLVAAIMAKRKRKDWVKLPSSGEARRGLDFNDLDDLEDQAAG